MANNDKTELPASAKVVIIGTGFAGTCMAIKLKEAGINDFVVLEKGFDVGGVWRENTYPGAACDIPSHLYSYSFSPKTNWSRRYPPQPEILEYLREIAEKYELRPHIRFGVEVESATFDDASATWTVKTRDGQQVTAPIFISGAGQLSRPAMPDLPGIEKFKGKAFHSANWDHDFELKGKKVAVVGTGASAIQFLPIIAQDVDHLTLFQRSAPWTLPKPDTEYSKLEKRMFGKLPGFRRAYRYAIWKFLGEGAFSAFENPGSTTGRILKWVSERQLRTQVADPELRKKLTPDYPIGCKRVLFTSNWYEALTRDNVSVENGGIKAITATGVRSADGELHKVDAIIYGTGFKATDFLTPMTIKGANGRDLNDAWRDGAEAYLGITVADFPNFFMLYGPNTNLGSNSIIFMIECQANYIMQCLKAMEAKQAKTLDVKPTVMREFNDGLQATLKDTVWNAGCKSWYVNEKGRNTNNWPALTAEYREITSELQEADYQFG